MNKPARAREPLRGRLARRRAGPAQTRPTPDLLQLIWLASPALPVGGFSYSEALESAVEQGWVSNESDAGAWLLDQLHLGLARCDLAVLAQAIPAWRSADLARVTELNAWVLHTRESAELRAQTEQMGRSLLDWLQSVQVAPPATVPDGGHPVPGLWQAPAHDRESEHLSFPLAFARVAALSAAPVRDCLRCFAFGWAENMMQAAVRAMPLGQGAGQRILGRLAGDIDLAVDQALQLPDDKRQAFAPMLAILSAQHETQYSRLFRS